MRSQAFVLLLSVVTNFVNSDSASLDFSGNLKVQKSAHETHFFSQVYEKYKNL